ncbi:MAG: 1-acyl-sn-glycerol-3-phosphate acyltransferase [Bacteroidales bacterium]|nr:1-acyl-sn-glycerol-3-phosphate acyltransferase [Bacteroidales bacterium]
MKEQDEPRFDMAREPVRTLWYLRPLTYLLSAPEVMAHKARIHYDEVTKTLKPPFLLLSNHNAFLDFKVLTKAIYPRRANYVVAIDGFIGREWLLRSVGCICKRKFTSDTTLVRHLFKVVENGDVAVIYPEARYSLCGTTAVLPESLGKLCKLLKVPVATFICHGHHVNSPFWNLHPRGIKPTEADFKLLFTPEDLERLSPDEINARLVEAFQYDDFAWLKERGLEMKYDKRAEGLDRVLYQCPHCGTEYEMDSKGNQLICKHCGKTWTMAPDGSLSADGGAATEFSHVPDWYEWERAQVRAEVEAGKYDTGELPVEVRSLPNAKRFIALGKGTMRHNADGFSVKVRSLLGREYEMKIPVPSMYSCHIEYNYLGKWGDCVDLNTLTDTWYTYPKSPKCSVTKMALATEELYFAYRRSIGKPCKPGLA